jgi:hypothetical protein
MCVHPQFWLLFGFNIHKWNPGVLHLLLILCNWEIHQHLCGTTPRKSRPKPLSVLCVPVSIFGTHLVQNLW